MIASVCRPVRTLSASATEVCDMKNQPAPALTTDRSIRMAASIRIRDRIEKLLSIERRSEAERATRTPAKVIFRWT